VILKAFDMIDHQVAYSMQSTAHSLSRLAPWTPALRREREFNTRTLVAGNTARLQDMEPVDGVSNCIRKALHAQTNKRRTAVRSVSRTGLLSLSRHSANAYRTATCKRRGDISRRKCTSGGELESTTSHTCGVR